MPDVIINRVDHLEDRVGSLETKVDICEDRIAANASLLVGGDQRMRSIEENTQRIDTNVTKGLWLGLTTLLSIIVAIAIAAITSGVHIK